MAPSRGEGPPQIPARLVQTLENHTGAVNCVRYNHGAKYVLTGSSDRSVRLWNAAAGKEIKVYQGHAHEILALDVAHDNAKFASCGGDKVVFVWDVASGKSLRKLSGHFGKINAVAFNTDAQVLASAGFDAKIMFWDMRANTWEPIQTIKDASSSITSLTISGASLYSSALDGHVRTYDLRLGKMFDDLVGQPVNSVRPSKIGDSLLASTQDGKVRLFDAVNGSLLQTFEGHRAGRARAIWGYGEESVLAGDEDGKLWAWDVLGAKPVEPEGRACHKKAITWLEMHPNGKEMVTASAGMGQMTSGSTVWASKPFKCRFGGAYELPGEYAQYQAPPYNHTSLAP